LPYLIIFQDECSVLDLGELILVGLDHAKEYHIMRLVVYPENNLFVMHKARSEFSPELPKFFRGRCRWIGRVADYLRQARNQDLWKLSWYFGYSRFLSLAAMTGR
jgi:hypothetical protein